MNIQKIATSLTISTFIIASVTGLLLFFEVSTGSIRATHEWLSILFLCVGMLHSYAHRKIFLRYFSSKYLYLVLSGLILAGGIFLSSLNDIYSAGIAFEKMTNAQIVHIAPVLNLTKEEIGVKLKKIGIMKIDTSDSLKSIAQANKKELHELMEVLLKK